MYYVRTEREKQRKNVRHIFHYYDLLPSLYGVSHKSFRRELQQYHFNQYQQNYAPVVCPERCSSWPNLVNVGTRTSL